MRNQAKYRMLVLFMCFALLILGIYLGYKFETKDSSFNEIAETVMNKNDKNNDDEVDIYTNGNDTQIKKYDIEVVYEDEYSLCSHIINNSDIIYNTTLDEVKKQEEIKQKETSNVYEIKEESKDRIVYYKKYDQNCPNHFFVKLENGMVVVYNVVNDSVKTIYQKIDKPTELLNPEMIEELNSGINANSKEELNLIIEDLES